MDIEIDYNAETKVITNKKKIKTFEYGLGNRIFKCMKLNQDSVAQIYAHTGEYDTYSNLLTKTIRTAIEMKRLGLKAGDIIVLCSYNQLNCVVPLLAAQFLGVIVATIDPALETRDVKFLLNIVKPRMIFISDNCEEWIESVIIGLNDLKIVTFGNSIKFYKFDEFLKPKIDEDCFEPIVIENGNETAIILFSSGTTGLPKGICLSHNYIFFNYNNFYDVMFSNFNILSYGSLFWISSVLMVFHHIEYNCMRLLCNKFDPDLFWKYVEKYKIDFVLMTPALAIRVYKTIPNNWFPKSLKYLGIGGSAISPIYLERISRSLPQTYIMYGYGLTEMGTCLMSYPNQLIYNNKVCTVGSPMPGFQFKIVDLDSDKPVGCNQPGELRIKSCYPMNGYYNRDSSDCFDDDGFLKTGDIVYYDEDLCFYISDRIKEMFKYLSWHIIPAKLEAILEKHEDVQLAVVVGIPHSEDDNHAAGVVILSNGATVTEKELQKFVDEQVDDRNKLRGGIRIVKSMPYTSSGKIMRRQIRDMIINGSINTL